MITLKKKKKQRGKESMVTEIVIVRYTEKQNGKKNMQWFTHPRKNVQQMYIYVLNVFW